MIGLLVAGAAGYFYLYQSHRDIETEKPSFQISSSQFLEEYTQSEEESNAKYLDKTVELKGKITSVDHNSNSIVVDEHVFCAFVQLPEVQVGDLVSVKGRVLGFDSLLEEIKLDQCTITK